MSIADKITRLQAAKTAIGTAITAKGGTVAAGDGFEDFAADVGTIPAGGVITLNDDTSANANYINAPVFQDVVLPERFEINLPHCKKFNSMFGSASSYLSNCWNAKEIIVHGPQTGMVTTVNSMFGRCSETTGYWGNMKCAIEKITLDFDMSLVSDYKNFFCVDYRTYLREINGVIDFSSVTTDSNANGFNVRLDNLTHIEFAKNTLSVNFSMLGASVLHDNVLLQLGNVLNESEIGKTLTLHATPKARLSAIVGTVAMDATNTYHIFTADAGGTVTLSDFITNTKGWTIA